MIQGYKELNLVLARYVSNVKTAEKQVSKYSSVKD